MKQTLLELAGTVEHWHTPANSWETTMSEREDRARKWLVGGGGGHEGGEDGLRVLSVSGFGLIGFLADYAEYLETAPDPQPAPTEGLRERCEEWLATRWLRSDKIAVNSLQQSVPIVCSAGKRAIGRYYQNGREGRAMTTKRKPTKCRICHKEIRRRQALYSADTYRAHASCMEKKTKRKPDWADKKASRISDVYIAIGHLIAEGVPIPEWQSGKPRRQIARALRDAYRRGYKQGYVTRAFHESGGSAAFPEWKRVESI